jgi:hypothetical protein
MRRNAASTSKQEEDDLGESSDIRSEDAVDAAEEILGRYLKPGRWVTKPSRARFLGSGELQHVLALYEHAMALDPEEPAYPWNLASALDRLGLHDLALVYVQRALRVATAAGDEEWADGNAHLAWADIALNAGEKDVALVAIERARSLDPSLSVERYIRRARQKRTKTSPPEHLNNRDAARKGKAVEHLVAASSMIASGFELNVSTSLVDDEGVDLVFHRRDSPVTLAVQIKSRSWSSGTMLRSSTFTAQVRDSTFVPRRDLYLLFVAVDSDFGDYGPVWLVPSGAFAERTTTNSRRRRRFVASAKPASRDQWSEFRLERSELPGRILEVLTELGG